MAIADRATATSDTNSTSLTYAHSVAGSSDLVLWVNVDDFASSGSADPTGITYAGAALTKISNYSVAYSTNNKVSLWRKIAPATGSNNVVVTHGVTNDITAMSISYSGVDQTTPNDTPEQYNPAGSPGDLDPTDSVVSATDDMVVSFASFWNEATIGEDGDLTIRLSNANFSGVNSMHVGDAPGAATVNCSWTTASGSEGHGLMSFSINPAVLGQTLTPDPATIPLVTPDPTAEVIGPLAVMQRVGGIRIR